MVAHVGKDGIILRRNLKCAWPNTTAQGLIENMELLEKLEIACPKVLLLVQLLFQLFFKTILFNFINCFCWIVAVWMLLGCCCVWFDLIDWLMRVVLFLKSDCCGFSFWIVWIKFYNNLLPPWLDHSVQKSFSSWVFLFHKQHFLLYKPHLHYFSFKKGHDWIIPCMVQKLNPDFRKERSFAMKDTVIQCERVFKMDVVPKSLLGRAIVRSKSLFLFFPFFLSFFLLLVLLILLRLNTHIGTSSSSCACSYSS